MSRKPLLIGLAVIVAASAAFASTASAKTGQFHSEVHKHTTLFASQLEGSFALNGGNVECEVIDYEADLEATTTETLTFRTKYGGCTAFGYEAEVIMNGCADILHAKRTKPDKPASLTKECKGEEEAVEIVAKSLGVTKCTITFPAQSELETEPIFTNDGSGTTRIITIHLSIHDLEYTQHAGMGLGACANEKASNGEFTGTLELTGVDTKGKHAGIWYSEE